jgi:hypothetical protein
VNTENEPQVSPYKLIDNMNGAGVITYTTPCGDTLTVAFILDIGGKDERIVLPPNIGGAIASNVFHNISALLKARSS